MKVESFSDEYFASLRGYNKLVLDELFYMRFLKYQYMLIYQLDAFVFKDELLLWAEKGYDYIGAPWIPPKHSYLTLRGRLKIQLKYFIYTLLNDDRRKLKKYCNYQVGNGGFSLRKINKMLEVTRFYREKTVSYTHLAFDYTLYDEENIARRRWVVDNYDPYLDGMVCERMLAAAADYIRRHGVPEKRKLNLWRKYASIKRFGRIKKR